ncbi:MAG: hypothetical protein KC680_04585 [Candidatus Peregrinibacteria bacterium]|nr:hypothetical protein [Candidatus Peregrinibacteria bacterium]MCB9808628.1 hypothetical protein [Candidatus Peribacteria bacterium]
MDQESSYQNSVHRLRKSLRGMERVVDNISNAAMEPEEAIRRDIAKECCDTIRVLLQDIELAFVEYGVEESAKGSNTIIETLVQIRE